MRGTTLLHQTVRLMHSPLTQVHVLAKAPRCIQQASLLPFTTRQLSAKAVSAYYFSSKLCPYYIEAKFSCNP